MEIKYSVIIPVYNAGLYLNQCLESVLDNPRSDLEIVAVDDGSTDDSFNILQKWNNQDHRVQIVSQKNAGVSAARNHGIQLARGKWIMFLDADDYFLHSPFENLDDVLQKMPDCKVYYFNSVLTKEIVLEETREEWMLATLGLWDKVTLCVKVDLMASACCKVYSVSLLRQNNLFFDAELTRGEDTIFNLEVQNVVDRIGLIQDEFYFYRHNEVSITHQFNPAVIQADMLFQKKLQSFCMKNNLEEVKKVGCIFSALGGISLICQAYFRYPVSKYQESKKKYEALLCNPLYQDAIEALRHGWSSQNHNAMQKITLWCVKKNNYFLGYVINKIFFQIRSQKRIRSIVKKLRKCWS